MKPCLIIQRVSSFVGLPGNMPHVGTAKKWIYKVLPWTSAFIPLNTSGTLEDTWSHIFQLPDAVAYESSAWSVETGCCNRRQVPELTDFNTCETQWVEWWNNSILLSKILPHIRKIPNVAGCDRMVECGWSDDLRMNWITIHTTEQGGSRIRLDKNSRLWMFESHGAMSGTNFKKNQKSKTPYLVHYKLYHLKKWLSSMERFDLDCYHIGEVSSSITTGYFFFFSEIYSLWLLLALLFTYLCTKNLTLPLRNL